MSGSKGECIENGHMSVEHVDGSHQCADISTKALPRLKLAEMRDLIGVKDLGQGMPGSRGRMLELNLSKIHSGARNSGSTASDAAAETGSGAAASGERGCMVVAAMRTGEVQQECGDRAARRCAAKKCSSNPETWGGARDVQHHGGVLQVVQQHHNPRKKRNRGAQEVGNVGEREAANQPSL